MPSKSHIHLPNPSPIPRLRLRPSKKAANFPKTRSHSKAPDNPTTTPAAGSRIRCRDGVRYVSACSSSLLLSTSAKARATVEERRFSAA